MNTSLLTLAALCLFIPSLYAAEPTLPSDSAAVVQAFRTLEANEMKAARDHIEPKRKEAIATLKRHLDRESRSGNLDAGLALKAQIESLDPTAPRSPSTGPVSAEPKLEAVVGSETELAALAGRKMKVELTGGAEMLLEFNTDRGIKVQDAKKRPPEQLTGSTNGTSKMVACSSSAVPRKKSAFSPSTLLAVPPFFNRQTEGPSGSSALRSRSLSEATTSSGLS